MSVLSSNVGADCLRVAPSLLRVQDMAVGSAAAVADPQGKAGPAALTRSLPTPRRSTAETRPLLCAFARQRKWRGHPGCRGWILLRGSAEMMTSLHGTFCDELDAVLLTSGGEGGRYQTLRLKMAIYVKLSQINFLQM